METWETTGLLSFEDKNNDGRLQYYNDGSEEFAEIADARGWEGDEMVNFNQDILVLANPEIANLPGWVIALIAAGGLAAALSTAAGLLLAISSAISHDLLKSVFMPKITDKQELLAARVSMGFAIALATYLGMNPPGFAAQVVALAFGLAAATLFPVLMMGIFSKKMNRQGAVVGMLVGLASTLVYIFLYLGWFFIPGTNMLENTPGNWLFGISPLSFGTIGALLNFARRLRHHEDDRRTSGTYPGAGRKHSGSTRWPARPSNTKEAVFGLGFPVYGKRTASTRSP